MFEAYGDLEGRFESTMNIVSRSGQQIDELARMRHRCQDAKELFQIFMELNSGQSIRLMTLLEDSANIESLRDAAKKLRRLLAIAESNIPGAEQSSEGIRAVAERFEQDMLARFQKAYAEGNMSQMKVRRDPTGHIS